MARRTGSHGAVSKAGESGGAIITSVGIGVNNLAVRAACAGKQAAGTVGSDRTVDSRANLGCECPDNS